VLALLVVLAAAVHATANPLPEPLPEGRPLTLSQLLSGRSSDWRVVRLRDNPAILVIEFPSLAEQGAALNRVAALVQKAGAPRDRVLPDEELAAFIDRDGDNAQTFFAGHDYTDADLVRFFRLAAAQGQPLNLHEERLRRVLVQARFLRGDAVPSAAGWTVQALITFTAVQPDDPATPFDEAVDVRRRESVLRHEYGHGLFHTQPAYRERCRRFWVEALSTAQRESIRTWLAGQGYDRHDEELMINEAQALLMHTPDTRAFDARSVGIDSKELAALRRQFWRDAPKGAGEHRRPHGPRAS
jgi:hypothetical protein